jgi:hypothetical protein
MLLLSIHHKLVRDLQYLFGTYLDVAICITAHMCKFRKEKLERGTHEK